MTKFEQAAEFLINLRKNDQKAVQIPKDVCPQSIEEGYAVQEAFVPKLLGHLGSTAIGYKVACTSVHAQELLHVDGPFYGRMIETTTHASGVTLSAGNFNSRVIEPEFAFKMGADVPAVDTPYTAETILPYLEALIPGIEIVDYCYEDFSTVGAQSLIAHNAVHGACILGTPVLLNDKGDAFVEQLATHPVILTVNGQEIERGGGFNVLGNPLTVMAWLANALQSHGKGLQSGDVIITGTSTNVYAGEAGDQIEVDYGEFGTVSVNFS
ncbi:MAG: fumarylacetoacetate hydrolase family protein [Chloroflexota bacterium]